MRELFEKIQPDNVVEAARRAARTVRRQRFYDEASVAAAAGGIAVRLDDKEVRTPAGRVLAAPTLALAKAIATEWDAQWDTIDPASMPLTRLVNAIIDDVSDRPGPVAAEIERYLGSDLVCYRACFPPGLVERQASHWNPLVAWAGEALGARFSLGEGVVHVVQPESALAAARVAIPSDPWRLGAVHSATTLTGSALIAFALLRGRLTPGEAWQAAHVDEDWNMEQWGRDELAMQRRAFRDAEFQAAATVLSSL